jgi:uncharacterized protein
LLFTRKKEKSGKPVHFLYYRRMFWLLLFGLFHAHVLLWPGDILYFYAICGMIAYLFRNVNPMYLAMGVPLVAIIDFTTNTLTYQDIRNQRLAYVEAKKVESKGLSLSSAQNKALKDWRELETTLIPNREDAKENTRKMKSDYSTVATYLRPISWLYQTTYLLSSIPDSLALMLLGIALLKWGFLTGDWTAKDYQRTMLIGYSIGLPLVIFETYMNIILYPNHEASLARMEQVPINWIDMIYPFQRIFLVMAHTAALILLYKTFTQSGLFKRLESVGQMAFSNYIMHTVFCTLFFYGYGLNYFATFDYYQIYYVVFVIWIIQLFLSPLWLRNFNFGPLEWLWRSLSYWKIQSFWKK